LDEAKIGDAQMAKQRLELLRPFPLLTINPEVVGLANALIRSGPLPAKAARDATHIALSRFRRCMEYTFCYHGTALTSPMRKCSASWAKSAKRTDSIVR
jgi:hypothetical protein